ncbi:V-type proton ATPase subunit a3 [Diplonema papillatum]|nr:V-type proton ATPase subunit a3 [Diplonema papillatum]
MRDIVCGTDADSYVEDVRSPGGSAGLGPVSGLWRSEEMELRSMSIERSVLERVARQLGELGCVEFKDLNAVSEEELREVDKKPAPRYFHTPIRTCEAIERILRVFEAQLAAHNISLADYTSNPAECPPLGVDEFRKVANITSLPNALETLRVKLQADEASLLDQVGKLEAYTQEYDSAIEEASVLEWAQVTCNDTLAANQRVLDEAADDITARSRSDEASSSALGQLIGVIDSGKLDTFHRLLYRVTKGHAVLKTDSVKDLDDKTVFRILYSSFEMQSRILKLIQSNGSTIYLVRPLSSYSGNSEPRLDGIHVLPSSPSAFGELQRKVYDDTSEREKLIHSTSSQVTELLTSLARVHRERRHYVVKEKALFHCLNMMKIDKGASFATAVAWIPSRFVPKVRAVVEAQHLCGLGKETLDVTEADVPPTYFETNDFTGTFQGIIDSYGVPRYREINPVAFTIVTFPWLFGLMYGDVGHGLMIVLGSVVMIYNQQTMKSMNLNEIVDVMSFFFCRIRSKILED